MENRAAETYFLVEEMLLSSSLKPPTHAHTCIHLRCSHTLWTRSRSHVHGLPSAKTPVSVCFSKIQKSNTTYIVNAVGSILQKSISVKAWIIHYTNICLSEGSSIIVCSSKSPSALELCKQEFIPMPLAQMDFDGDLIKMAEVGLNNL